MDKSLNLLWERSLLTAFCSSDSPLHGSLTCGIEQDEEDQLVFILQWLSEAAFSRQIMLGSVDGLHYNRDISVGRE